MRKIVTCCGLFIAGAIVIVAFVTATTYLQLSVAIILYPLLVYFVFKTFPRHAVVYTPTQSETMIQSTARATETDETESEVPHKARWDVLDIDKRAFLHLISGAGLTYFLFALIGKRNDGLFSKSSPSSGNIILEDTGGNKIDPSQNQPTDGYRICEIDDNIVAYYGFTNKDGAWFVMQEDSESGSFRYTQGEADFPGNWKNRQKLKYDYFDNVF